jgi:hypothetical protein
MKKTQTLRALLLISLMAVPMIVLAQTSGVASINSGLNQAGGIITTLTNSVVRALSTLAATAAMVAFFYGIVQYIWGIREGNEDRVKKGNLFLRWGLVALFVMFSVWGIIIYVQRIFGIDNSNNIIIPTIQLQGGSTQTNSNPLQPADGTVYWTCNGTQYSTEAAYLQACPQNSTSGNNNTATDSCAGKNAGSACTIPGWTGAASCQNGDSGFQCYAGESASTGSGGIGADCTSAAECSSGLSCRNFTCQGSSGSVSAGADCTSSAECGGLTCTNFKCQ